jgi:hypothetical protein
LWATLAVICLVGAAAAYGVTRYLQSELEADATRDARKLSIDVLQPLLVPADADGPIRGARYGVLGSEVEERVLAGPISAVKLWAADGTIVFADHRDLVGEREAAMRDDIHSVIAGTSQSVVEGDRFSTLTVLEVGNPPTLLVAELVRSHAAIVEGSRETWYPWMERAITGAIVCFVLFVATAIGFFAFGVVARRTQRTREPAAVVNANGSAPHRRDPAKPERRAPAAHDDDVPAYMLPGFREEVESRQRVEEELKATRSERDALLERLRRLEAELEQARSQTPSRV